jgi:hypothetical protein
MSLAWSHRRSDLFKRKAEPFSSANRGATAGLAAGIFFPQRLLLRLDAHGYSPTVLHKILSTTAEVKSHQKAAELLGLLCELPISGRHVNRLAVEVGREMADQRDQATEDYLHHRRKEPTAVIPEVVAIGMDGGRVLTRTPGQGTGVHGQGWKEDKVACLLSMQGTTFSDDPHPEPPKCFLDAPKVDAMVREIQANHGVRQENELPQLEELGLGKQTTSASSATSAADETEQKTRPAWPPQRTKNSRTCVATMQDCHAFGQMVVTEAYRRNFQAAPRGAFLGDGGAWIWTQHSKWFSWLTPVADFVHPLTYLYVTATVLATSVSERWQTYVGWMTLCWQGQVLDVIADMEARLAQREPHTGSGKLSVTDPREVLRRTIGYLCNNQDRMKYGEYRKQGLPVTSSMVESLIKEFNYRVKGTEKFWDNPEGAEAILQLRAAVLSDDGRLQGYFENRAGSAFRRRAPRKCAKAA